MQNFLRNTKNIYFVTAFVTEGVYNIAIKVMKRGFIMNKIFYKTLTFILSIVICIGAIFAPVSQAFAETSATTTWYGDNVKLDIVTGEDAYTYMLFGDKPNYYYYETSNHTVLKEVTKGGAVHVLGLIDTKKYKGEWTPNGLYEFGKSNYDLVYCCDAATGIFLSALVVMTFARPLTTFASSSPITICLSNSSGTR